MPVAEDATAEAEEAAMLAVARPWTNVAVEYSSGSVYDSRLRCEGHDFASIYFAFLTETTDTISSESIHPVHEVATRKYMDSRKSITYSNHRRTFPQETFENMPPPMTYADAAKVRAR